MRSMQAEDKSEATYDVRYKSSCSLTAFSMNKQKRYLRDGIS